MSNRFHSQLLLALPHLQRFCRYLAKGSAADAEDLSQRTIERALARQDQWQEQRGTKGWLLRIAYTQFINERKSSHAQLRSIENHDDEASETSEPFHDDNPENLLAAKQISDALMLLPTEQRSLLILVSVEGYSYREAAELMDIPVGTVMSRLARGRKAIRLWYEAQENPLRNEGTTDGLR